MSIIKRENLPMIVTEFITSQEELGGEVSLIEDKILDSKTENGIIIECIYEEDDIELRWFETEGIYYLFINGVNHCYLEDENEGVIFINN
jgi:hypothetical protein